MIGLLGAGGELYGVFSKLYGKYALIIFALSSSFIFIWGIVSRTEASPSLKRSLAWLAIPVGLVALVFFAVIGIVLISLLGEAPAQSGKLALEHVDEFAVNSNQPANQLTGQHRLSIIREADSVEIAVAPKPQDLDAVEELYITTKGPLESANKMTLLLGATNNTQTSYRIEHPTQDFDVTLNCMVNLKRVQPSPAITVQVYYKYLKQDWLWRLQKWVYETYGG